MTLDDLRGIALLLEKGNPRITFNDGANPAKEWLYPGEFVVLLDAGMVGRELRFYSSIFAQIKGEGPTLVDFYVEVIMPLIRFLSDDIKSQVKQKLLDLGKTVFYDESLSLWQDIIA